MKKVRVGILSILLILICLVPKPVFTFAGGGGADYNGGGQTTFCNHRFESYNEFSPFIVVILVGIAVTWILKEKHSKPKYKEIKLLDQASPDEFAVYQFVKETFFCIQEA